VVGVIARQVVEGEVATVLFLIISFFFSGQKGRDGKFIRHRMNCGEVRPSHAVQYGAVVCGVGVACCAVMSADVTNYQGKQA